MTVLYFGCLGQPGHYLFHATGERFIFASASDPGMDVRAGQIDGVFTPKHVVDQSAAALSKLGRYTVVAWHDYTIDKRGGSNSAFLVEGDHSFEEALRMGYQHFPQVHVRLRPRLPYLPTL